MCLFYKRLKIKKPRKDRGGQWLTCESEPLKKPFKMRKIKFKLILRVGSIVITISNYLTKIRNGEREVKCENEVPP